ncbi:hypothetical protein HXX76_000121 [Chlamydomonas incerta]|uniref:Uncharacterized protein n=1 Tax=Chlamydomonas incerta TaxID=51695 RepID=A0A836B266_CHLIN|nr:hypothetical protein HXX76_000121 [Chlamydomonas incerta]|eukprot:KAG2445505.1 hypothetical protein HXX76_000121 [Chlamydomonas incerta]
MQETLATYVPPKDETRRPEEVFRAAREVASFRSQQYSYERRVQYAHENSRKIKDARLQYGKAHKLDGGLLPNAAYYDDEIEEWSSDSDSDSNSGASYVAAAGLQGRAPMSQSSGSHAAAAVLTGPAPPADPDDGGNGGAASGAATGAAAKGAAGSAAEAGGAAGEAAPYAPYNTASWPARFVVLPSEGDAAAAVSNGGASHPSQQPNLHAVHAAVAAAAALADPERGGAAGATQRAGMVLGRSSSNRRMSGAQPTWLLRSDHSGSVAAAAASLAAAGGADGGGGRPGSGRIPTYAAAPPAPMLDQLLDEDVHGPSLAALGRGRSFTNGHGPVDYLGADGTGGGVAASALSFTAGGAGSSSSSSRALKPTLPAPLRATTSFTLGSSNRPSTAARARAGAGAAAAVGGVPAAGNAPAPSPLPSAPPVPPLALPQQQAQQKPAPLTRALSLNLNRLASSIGLNYMKLGRRDSQSQAPATAAETAASRGAADCEASAESDEYDEAADQLSMLRGGRGGSSTAAGDHHVERSWKSFTMGLRRHTGTNDSCDGGLPAAAALGGSFSAAGSGVVGLGGASMRVRFVPGGAEDDEEGDGQEQQQGARGQYGLRRTGSGRRSTFSNVVVPQPYESVSALQAGGARPPPLLTQPPPPLQSRNSSGTSGGAAQARSGTGDGGAAAAAAAAATAQPQHAIPVPPPMLRAQSFTNGRRSSVLLSAAASELAHAMPQPQPNGVAPHRVTVGTGDAGNDSDSSSGVAAVVAGSPDAPLEYAGAAAAPMVVRAGLFGQRELPQQLMRARSSKTISVTTAAAAAAPPPAPAQKANWREVPMPVGAPPRSDRVSSEDVFRIMRTSAK